MRLYIDANVIIYAVEGLPQFRTPARLWLQRASEARAEFVTSFFTEFECRVGPLKGRDFALLDTYAAFLRQPSWQLVPLTFNVLRRAAAIRAEHNLKPPDAIQAATCLEARCDLFLTNDRTRFQRLPDLQIASVDAEPSL